MLERSFAEQRISALRATSGAGGVVAETGRERPRFSSPGLSGIRGEGPGTRG